MHDMEEKTARLTRPEAERRPAPEGAPFPVIVEPLVERAEKMLAARLRAIMSSKGTDPDAIAASLLRRFEAWVEEAERPEGAVGPTATRLVLIDVAWSPGAGEMDA